MPISWLPREIVCTTNFQCSASCLNNLSAVSREHSENNGPKNQSDQGDVVTRRSLTFRTAFVTLYPGRQTDRHDVTREPVSGHPPLFSMPSAALSFDYLSWREQLGTLRVFAFQIIKRRRTYPCGYSFAEENVMVKNEFCSQTAIDGCFIRFRATDVFIRSNKREPFAR